MSPRTGRPRLERTLATRISARLDNDTVIKLDLIVAAKHQSRSEFIRDCIEREYQALEQAKNK